MAYLQSGDMRCTLCSLASAVYMCSRYVEDGVLDAGICGRDWIVENGAYVVEVPQHICAHKRSAQYPLGW